MKRNPIAILVVLLLHFPLFAYPVLRLAHWLDFSQWLTIVLFVPAFFSQIIARLYLGHVRAGWLFWLRRAADVWLGLSPLVLGMLLLVEIPVALNLLAPAAAAYCVIALSLMLLTYSVLNAYSPSVVKVRLTSGKLSAPLRFVQITDVHIGSRSVEFLQRVMEQVNDLEADFLCITGDFIDAPGVNDEQLAALASCPIPIYFSIGNHERYEDLEEILACLERLGVKVLRTQSVMHGEVQLIGIDDRDHPKQVFHELKKVEVDQSNFVLLMYHRPRGLEAAAAAGIDLMISGHTHNGQIVPFNFVVAKVFEKTVGLFSEGPTRLYVSPGTGTWGPIMRLGSRGEITLFEVDPVETTA